MLLDIVRALTLRMLTLWKTAPDLASLVGALILGFNVPRAAQTGQGRRRREGRPNHAVRAPWRSELLTGCRPAAIVYRFFPDVFRLVGGRLIGSELVDAQAAIWREGVVDTLIEIDVSRIVIRFPRCEVERVTGTRGGLLPGTHCPSLAQCFDLKHLVHRQQEAILASRSRSSDDLEFEGDAVGNVVGSGARQLHQGTVGESHIVLWKSAPPEDDVARLRIGIGNLDGIQRVRCPVGDLVIDLGTALDDVRSALRFLRVEARAYEAEVVHYG